MMIIMENFSRAILIIFSLFLSSCASESEDSKLVDFVGKPSESIDESISLASISLSSTKTSFNIGETSELTAIGVYSDGSSSNITSSATWTSGDSSIATISGNNATATGAGAVTITVTLDGVSNSIVLVPFSASLSSIELSQESLTLPLGSVYDISVYALYDNGLNEDITEVASYTIDDGAVASIDASGRISSLASGTAIITVAFGGQSKTLNLTVSSAQIDSLQVTPIVGSRAINMEQSFYATASLDDGTTLDMTNAVSWTSSDETVLSIDVKGKASLKKSGTATVSANYNSFSSSVNFTVLNKRIDSIEVSLSSSSLSTNTSGLAICTAHYSDGTSEDISDSVSFISSDQSIGIISNNSSDKGTITPVGIGSTEISVNFEGFSDSKTLNITTATLQTITISTLDSLLSAGINAYFFAEGSYDDGSTIDITQSVTWSLSNSNYGHISNSSKKGFYTNNFSDSTTGSLTISADLDGITGTLDIVLAPGVISSITITPSSAIMNTNQNLDYQAFAHFDDGASVDITSIATWTSSDTSIAMASNAYIDAGRISTLAEGSVNIVANYKSLSSNTATLEIDNSQTPGVSEEGDGLLARYYSGKAFETFMGSRVDSQVNFNWSTGNAPLGVGNSFSVRWSGKILGKETGDCTIASRSDDGFRVYINGVAVIDVWYDHAPTWHYNYAVPFVEGEKQDIVVEFYENGGNAVAEVYWQCASDASLEAIQTEYLFSQ